MPIVDIAYDKLPSEVKDNLSAEQWDAAQRGVILAGGTIPESTAYLNLKTGQARQYTAGEPADGPLLPVHDLSGGRGADETQFHTRPRGALTET